jgi:CheY-like chemotaxis protein
MDKLVKEQFAHHLQRALTALYDPTVLRSSMLLQLLGLSEQRDPVLALRRVLTEAIEALKPDELAPRESRGRRMYQILRRRYVEQLTQHEVATSLGLGIRQLQREEKLARELLVDRLWTDYHVAAQAHLLTDLAQLEAAQRVPGSYSPSAAQELESLSNVTLSQVIQLDQVIREVLNTLTPLLQSSHTTSEYEEDMDLPPLTAKLPMLRQALLYTASLAIRQAFGGRLHVRAYHTPTHAFIRWEALPEQGAPHSESDDLAETLEMVRQLLAFSDGSLHVDRAAGSHAPAGTPIFTAIVELPVAQLYPVLVIDDNADTRQLLERYMLGTPYQFMEAEDAMQALALLQRVVPRAIVLDVMMPKQDGWVLLEQIREHPRLQGIPVIVSTILPQSDLAYALGAAGFIRKPIRRSELLAALARHLGLAKESGS